MLDGSRQDVCRVPVVAEFRMVDGEPFMISAQYTDIPAAELLRFLLERSGMRPRAEVNCIESG